MGVGWVTVLHAGATNTREKHSKPGTERIHFGSGQAALLQRRSSRRILSGWHREGALRGVTYYFPSAIRNEVVGCYCLPFGQLQPLSLL